MSLFLMGMFDDIVEECRSAILHDHMDIYRLMVHSQKVEETRLKRKNREEVEIHQVTNLLVQRVVRSIGVNLSRKVKLVFLWKWT